MSDFPEIDPKYLPASVSGATWDPVVLRAICDAHIRHPWDHKVEVKAWVVLTLLDAWEERNTASDRGAA